MKLRQLLNEAFEVKDGRIVSKHDDKIPGGFGCASYGLTSLEGCPSYVGGSFSCADNFLTSLEHCPSSVGVEFRCGWNQLTTLKGIHKLLKKMDGTFYADRNPIKSHVLGLFFVQGCREVTLDNKQVEKIMNKHLKDGRDGLIPCQNELIEAGFEEFAQI